MNKNVAMMLAIASSMAHSIGQLDYYSLKSDSLSGNNNRKGKSKKVKQHASSWYPTETKPTSEKFKRNDLCYCGSGKKNKHCHFKDK